eukprot:COSAG02_NODE_3378_length_6839_cov_12.056973_2_plen_544_part_00
MAGAGAGVLCTSHKTVRLGDYVDSGGGCGGLYFGLHCSQGRALLLNALGLAGNDYYGGGDSEVCLYVCVEGDGAGREQQREAWREVARGTIKDKTVTRLALSSPVAVGDGATVGFYVRATKGGVMICGSSKRGALGTVDASDGVLSVLRGGKQSYSAGLFGECYDYPHNCAAFVGLVEYTLTIAESVPPEPAPAPAMKAEAEPAAALAQAVRAEEKARADAAIAQAAAHAEEAAQAQVLAAQETAQAQVLAAQASQAQADAKATLAEAAAAEARAALAVQSEQAAAVAASPASSGPTIDGWLAELELGDFAAPMKQQGYTSLRFLIAAEEEDLDELAQDIGMKKPHLRVLKRTWKILVADAGSAGADGTSGGAAASPPASEPEPVSADDTSESHGQTVAEVMQPGDEFDFVFSNKTASDALCLDIRATLTARGLRVWQQKTNIPKDSDNWFNEWFPSAVKSRKIVCFLTVAYLKSPYCMKEFGIALASHKLLVVACEPLAQINAVDPSAYPFASNALAYLLNGGQVIFHDSEDVVAEILKFVQ